MRHPFDPVFYVPVPGTWAFRATPSADDWYHPSSALSIYFTDRALFQIGSSRPFEWTTDPNGWRPWRRWFGVGDSDHRDWLVAGRNLYAWLRPPVTDSDDYVKLADRNIIAHSHALQVALYACASGLKINKLISLAGPVRDDMRAIAAAARPNIGRWIHVHSDKSDRTQWLGEWGDGVLRIVRAHPLADMNIAIPRVGHSDMLHKTDAFHWWEEAGLVAFLRSLP